LFKRRKIVAHNVPEHVVGDAVILMAQDIADARHFRPFDVRMPRLEFVAEVAAGFGNDLNAALDQPAFTPVGLEGHKGNLGHFCLDQLDGFNNVSQARGERAFGHQNTWSAEASMRCFRSGWRLRRVVMSALRPSARAAASLISINWNRPMEPSGW